MRVRTCLRVEGVFSRLQALPQLLHPGFILRVEQTVDFARSRCRLRMKMRVECTVCIFVSCEANACRKHVSVNVAKICDCTINVFLLATCLFATH